MERQQGVTIWRIPHVKFGKRLLAGRAVNMLSYLAGAMAAAMFASRPAAIVVESDPFLLPLLGRLLRWRHRCPLIVYLQDVYPDVAVALGKIKDRWWVRVLRRCLFAVYEKADCVVVLGEDMRDLLTASGVPGDHIHLLPNWADTTRIVPIREENAFRQREQLDGRFVVMYSGNMGLCQDLDQVLEAADRLRARHDIEFVFVGDGASRARLEHTARERRLPNVRFRPYQPQSELAHSLSAADLHLIPLDARVTGCLVPSKLYGILAAGVASVVVADEQSEPARVVQRAGVGKVVAPRDPGRLADMIGWCADHRNELDEMGLRARALAEKEYDRAGATARFGALLNEVIAGISVPSAPVKTDDLSAAEVSNRAPTIEFDAEPSVPIHTTSVVSRERLCQ